MGSPNAYTESHLVVAAIRVLEYQHTRPPSIDEVCDVLSISLEKGNRICRRLTDLGVVNLIEGAYGPRLSITDHLKLEDIPQEAEEDELSKAVKKFQEERSQITKKVASIKADQAEKQKSLFAELEKQLKQGVDTKS